VLTGSGGLSFQHTVLDDTQIEVILRAVEKSERIQQITAPTITVYNTQRANVSVLNQLSYVQDYDVEIAQASNIANPIIQTIQDGIVLDVRPVVSADRRFVTLELRPTVALLTRPIATFSTSLASGPITASAPVIIQIPELRVSRVRTTVTMPDGGTLLLGGLKFYEQITENSGVPFLSEIPVLSFLMSRKGNYVNKRNLLILITAEIVPLEELEPKSGVQVPPVPSGVLGPVGAVEREFAPPPTETPADRRARCFEEAPIKDGPAPPVVR
jgi:type II secretory pathway component GspD/PulD (secretin)